ncbi:Anaerobic C4-dicarboxylate transporter DcuB, partial [Haemophilus influenzae]
MLYLE